MVGDDAFSFPSSLPFPSPLPFPFKHELVLENSTLPYPLWIRHWGDIAFPDFGLA